MTRGGTSRLFSAPTKPGNPARTDHRGWPGSAACAPREDHAGQPQYTRRLMALFDTADSAAEPITIIRSVRRRRTISARRRGAGIEIHLPAGMSAQEEAKWVERMTKRLRRKPAPGDEDLMRRSDVLSRRFFAGELTPASVRWSEHH